MIIINSLEKAFKFYNNIAAIYIKQKEHCDTCPVGEKCEKYCDFAHPFDIAFYLNEIIRRKAKF